MNEERGRAQVREMLRALLLGTARGMQRIREQEQAGGEIGFFGAEHAGLTSPIRMAANAYPSRDHFSDGGHCVFQTGAVACGVAGAGRPEGSYLAKREIAAEHCETGLRE